MVSFEVFFTYKSQAYAAYVNRENPVPDIITIEGPNNLHLPSIFMLASTNLEGSPIFKNHPGLDYEIAKAINDHFLNKEIAS